MAHDLIDLVFHPGRFFTRKTGEPPDYLLPVLIVGAASLVYLAMEVMYPVPAPDTGFLVFTLVLNVFGPFIDWVVIALVLYVFCRAFSGTGTFPATFRNTGYGMLPLPLIAVVELIITPYLNNGVATNDSSIFLVVFIALLLLNIILVAWSGLLWMHAMEAVHAIIPGDALVAALIAGVFYILWSMSGWLWLVVR
jgi:hypothetical protein